MFAKAFSNIYWIALLLCLVVCISFSFLCARYSLALLFTIMLDEASIGCND
ncbi:MAG: hypothetical protein KAY16_04625 [Spirochaetes bacterium]|nr:hypothetical protein [Spirochaetota bacterium]